MGPPSDYLPQPVEIRDLSLARTLPTPLSFAPAAWDHPSPFPTQGFGDTSYGQALTSKMQQNSVDSQNPISAWYAQDGPWVLKDALPDDISSRQAGKSISLSYPGQYRQQNPSEAGSYQVGILHSDSGYGTRRSVGTTSVFSAEFTDRDQDAQSLAGHMQDFNFNPHQSYGNGSQRLEVRTEQWSTPSLSNTSALPRLHCPTCNNSVKTPSELKYARSERVSSVNADTI